MADWPHSLPGTKSRVDISNENASLEVLQDLKDLYCLSI